MIATFLSWWAVDKLHIYKALYTKLTTGEGDEADVSEEDLKSFSFADWILTPNKHYDLRGE